MPKCRPENVHNYNVCPNVVPNVVPNVCPNYIVVPNVVLNVYPNYNVWPNVNQTQHAPRGHRWTVEQICKSMSKCMTKL